MTEHQCLICGKEVTEKLPMKIFAEDIYELVPIHEKCVIPKELND